MLTPAGGELPERRGRELLERRGVQLGNYLNADNATAQVPWEFAVCCPQPSTYVHARVQFG
jgi:hypothetical protein